MVGFRDAVQPNSNQKAISIAGFSTSQIVSVRSPQPPDGKISNVRFLVAHGGGYRAEPVTVSV